MPEQTEINVLSQEREQPTPTPIHLRLSPRKWFLAKWVVRENDGKLILQLYLHRSVPPFHFDETETKLKAPRPTDDPPAEGYIDFWHQEDSLFPVAAAEACVAFFAPVSAPTLALQRSLALGRVGRRGAGYATEGVDAWSFTHHKFSEHFARNEHASTVEELLNKINDAVESAYSKTSRSPA